MPSRTPPLNSNSPWRRPDLRTQLRFRIWGDATYGTLSSNGQYVFAVEDLPLDAGFTQNQFMFANRRDAPTDSRSFNRLAAYDIRTGKLVWHVGGSPDDLGLPLAGSFFLGPPLPLAGVLYVIADYKGEVRLIALETQSGKQLWTQQLAETDQQGGILQSPLRRLSGVSPSYADGVLVCPTANKSIVALDLVTRSLLWGYAYADRDINARQPTRMFFGLRQVHVDLEPSARWTDSSATIAEGRVLVTPIDSNHLDCLNLVDGKLLWRKPREDSLYLAGVHRGKAIVVGRRSIRALQLANGEPAWGGRAVDFPSGAMPSGTGFLAEDLYYVPLSSGEVAAIDLSAGKIVRGYRSHHGAVPGNLVCCKGRIISQRAAAVEMFQQLDALRKKVQERLAANPNDAGMLAQQGEILWEDGKLAEAVASLRKAYELSPGPNHRNLLRDALLEGMRTDFALYRAHSEEIERLLDEPRQEATYLRLMAAGLEASGEFDPAFDRYLKLIELGRKGAGARPAGKRLPGPPRPLDPGPTRQAARDGAAPYPHAHRRGSQGKA